MSRGSGITPEYVVHCEPGFMQKYVTGRVRARFACGTLLNIKQYWPRGYAYPREKVLLMGKSGH